MDNKRSMRKRQRAGAIAARNIERLRVEQGIAAGVLSERAGLARSHVGKIVRGKINPGIDTLDRIANVLGVPLGELLVPMRGGKKVIDAADLKWPDPDLSKASVVIYDNTTGAIVTGEPLIGLVARKKKGRWETGLLKKKGGDGRDVEGTAGAAGGADQEETRGKET
jgi:transcriptional regulator with XRE-family HTH domain